MSRLPLWKQMSRFTSAHPLQRAPYNTVICNTESRWLRLTTTALSSVSVFSLWLAVRRLLLCEELDRSSCGSVLFHGYLPPPGKTTAHTENNTSLEIFAFLKDFFFITLNWHIVACFSCFSTSTAIPAQKSSPVLAASASSSDSRSGPSGVDTFARVGPPPHPSLSGSPGNNDNEKLSEYPTINKVHLEKMLINNHLDCKAFFRCLNKHEDHNSFSVVG